MDEFPVRCWPTTDPAYIAYHDEVWGRPIRDERGLYERVCLEGFQAGLAWITILRKREAFRAAFAGFDPERVARFGERDVERLLGDAGDRDRQRSRRGLLGAGSGRGRALALEDLFEARQVLRELPLCLLRDETAREAGDVTVGDDPESCPVLGRLELVCDGETDRPVERLQREHARCLALEDLERRAHVAPEEGACLLNAIAGLDGGAHARLPRRQVRDVGQVRENVLGRPADLDGELRVHRLRISVTQKSTCASLSLRYILSNRGKEVVR